MKYFSQYKGLRKENYILFLGRIVTSLGSMVYPVLTLLLNQKLGLTATETSLFFAISQVVYIPTSLIGGKIADKWNKKKIIVWCDFMSVAMYLVCGILPFGFHTVVIMVFASALQNLEGPAYSALVADINRVEDRDRAYSLLYLGMNIGLVASPTIAGMLLNNHVNLIFIISGVSIGISTILIALFVKNITPVQEEGEIAKYQERRENMNVLKYLKDSPVIVMFFLATTMYWIAYGQFGFLMPLDIAREFPEIGSALYGTVSSVNCIVVILFTPAITYLLRKMRSLNKMITGYFLMMAGFALYLFVGITFRFPPFFYVGIVVFTYGEIVTSITQDPFIENRIPASHRGRVQSILGVISSITQSLMGILVGAIYDAPGDPRTGSYIAWGFVFFLGILAVIGTAFTKKLDKKYYPAFYEKAEGENASGEALAKKSIETKNKAE